MSKEKKLEKAQRKAGMNQVTVLELLIWGFAPYALCQILYAAGEISTKSEAHTAGLVGSAACILLNLFLIVKGSYRLVWKRSKKKDPANDVLPEAAKTKTTAKTAAELARAAAEKAAKGSGGKVRWSADDPDYMSVKDPVTGAESGYRLNPDTGEWTDIESGSVLDPDGLPDWLNTRAEDRKWVDKQNEKIRTRKTAQDQALEDIKKAGEEEARRLEEEARHVQEIWDKYHTLDDSPEHLKEIIRREQRLNEIEADRTRRKGNVMAVLEGGARWVQIGADYGVDFLSAATGPAGKHIIKNGYIVARNFTGRLSEAVVYGKDLGLAASHALGDTTIDILQNEFSNASWGARFAVNAGGDSYKAVMQALSDGENPVEAGVTAFFSGSVGTGLEAGISKGTALVKKQYASSCTEKLLNLNREYMKGSMKKSVWQGSSQVITKQMQQGTQLIENLGDTVITDAVKGINTKVNDSLFNTHQKMH